MSIYNKLINILFLPAPYCHVCRFNPTISSDTRHQMTKYNQFVSLHQCIVHRRQWQMKKKKKKCFDDSLIYIITNESKSLLMISPHVMF